MGPMELRVSRPSSSTSWVATCFLLLLVGLSGVSAVADDSTPPAREALQARVDEAIDAGAKWLRAQQREDGSFPLARMTVGPLGDHSDQWAGGPWDKGLDALSVYTLAVCGVERDDPALVKGFENLRRLWAGRQPPRDGIGAVAHADGISTYFVSLCLLALDAAYNRGAAPLGKGPPDPKRKGKRLLGKTNFAWAKELVKWLEAAQDPGAHGRSSKRSGRSGRRRAPASGRGPSLEDGGGFGYVSPADPGSYQDHSNSQFAVLGLKSAARLGVRVSDVVFLRALRHFLAAQETEGPEVDRVDAPDAVDPKAGLAPGESRTTDEAPKKSKDIARGWGYMCPGSRNEKVPVVPGGGPGGGALPPGLLPGFPEGVTPFGDDGFLGRPTPSMTAGGVSTLVICRSELDGVRGFTKDLRQLTVKGIRDGFAWLALSLEDDGKAEPILPPGFDPGALPPGVPGIPEISSVLDDFYFLYGLERACILGGVGTVGGTAWYNVGARRIVDRQREDGSFLSKDRSNGNGRPEIDSCFALLFLKRAVFRVPDRRVVTPSD